MMRYWSWASVHRLLAHDSAQKAPTDYGTHLSYCLMSPLVQKESRGGAGKRFLASESFTHSQRAFDGLTIASVTAPLRSNFITSLTDGYFGSLDTVLH